MLKKIVFVLFASINLMAMHSIELNINNVDLETGVSLDMGQFNNHIEPDSTFVNFRYIKGDESHSDYASTSSFFEASFLIKRDIGNKGFYGALGVKLNSTKCETSLKTYDFMSIPLGLSVGYKLNAIREFPMFLEGSFYYAPQVLSLQDAKDYYEYRIKFEIEVVKNGRVYVGYRDLNTNYDVQANGDVSYNHSAYLGFKFRF